MSRLCGWRQNWAVVVVFACLLALPGYASPDQSLDSIGMDYAAGKIGGQNDGTEIAKAVWAELTTAGVEGDHDRALHAARGLAVLEEAASNAYPVASAHRFEAEILWVVRATLAEFREPHVRSRLGAKPAWDIDQDDLTWAPIGTNTFDFAKFYGDLLGARNDASEAYARTVAALRVADLARRCVEHVRLEVQDAAFDFAALRDKQWTVYFDGGIPQWPWELALFNGPLYAYTARTDKGLAPPPTWQLIVVHPDVALEYLDEAPDGDQFKPALSVEIIGADFWSWKKDGEQTGPLFGYPVGGGVVANFSDRAGVQDWGFGAVLHINHRFNVGATFPDGHPAFFVSANIGKLFQGLAEKKREYFQ